MIPSNLNLHVGKIMNYNNNVLIAPDNTKVGEIQNLNVGDKTPKGKKKEYKPVGELPHHEKIEAKNHDDEKQALIIVGVSLILGVIWFYEL